MTPTAAPLTDAAGTSTIDPLAMSYYLGLRYVPVTGVSWIPGISPRLPEPKTGVRPVATSDDVLTALREIMPRGPGVGLLLSAGIDSAILAALAEPGTPCFTIAFDAPGAIDESGRAARYAARWGHPHHVVRCGWEDYKAHVDALMLTKAAPLHAAEVPLHLAARTARAAGIDRLVVGNGADSTFGGMDKLLSTDWSFDGFIDRYRFARAELVLRDPADITHVFEPYRTPGGIDVQRFLRELHGRGIVQAFENAIGTAGVTTHAPYEDLVFDGKLDIARIRAGQPKYLLQDVFRCLYGDMKPPTKIAFARPTDIWFAGWEGPVPRRELRCDVGAQLTGASGETKWLTWCLARFCTLLDEHRRG